MKGRVDFLCKVHASMLNSNASTHLKFPREEWLGQWRVVTIVVRRAVRGVSSGNRAAWRKPLGLLLLPLPPRLTRCCDCPCLPSRETGAVQILFFRATSWSP